MITGNGVTLVGEAIFENNAGVGVQLDPEKCGFGKGLISDEAKELMAKSTEIKSLLNKVKSPHEKLHATTAKIDLQLKIGLAVNAAEIYQKQTKLELEKVVSIFNETIAHEKILQDGRSWVIVIFQDETLPSLSQTRDDL
jgi:methyl-accepting chemotaxis protein